MKNLKNLLVMLMVMTLTFGLVGCGSKESNSNSNNSNAEVTQEVTDETVEENVDETTEEIVDETTNEEAVVDTEYYPVEVTDSNGTTHTFTEEPQTVVSVAPNLTELLYELGEGDKLVGRTDYCDYPEEVLNVPSIGTLYTPDLEAIVALEPDVVLVSTHFEEEDEAKLTELGVEVVYLYDEADIYGVYDIINTVGAIFNKVDEAAALVEDMQATIDEVVAAVEGQEQPTVYYVVGYGESDYTATGDTFIHGLLTLAGGDNIAKDGLYWSYSLESLLEADPDIIIIGTGLAEDFCATENYSELTAVKEGRVYEMDSYHLLDRQGYRNAEAVKELAKLFYPDLIQ